MKPMTALILPGSAAKAAALQELSKRQISLKLSIERKALRDKDEALVAKHCIITLHQSTPNRNQYTAEGDDY